MGLNFERVNGNDIDLSLLPMFPPRVDVLPVESVDELERKEEGEQ